MKLYLRLLTYIKPYWRYVLGSIVYMLLLAIANVMIIPLVRDLSTTISHKDFSQLNLIALYAMLLYLLRGLFQYGQAYNIAYAGQKAIVDMRVRIYQHLQDLSLDFYAKWRTGEIISRVLNDLAIIQTTIMALFIDLAPHFLTLIGVVGYLIYLNWRLTAVTLLILPFFVIAIAKFGDMMRIVARKTQRKTADLTSILQETISSAREVKSFTMEKEEIKRFARESERGFFYSMKEIQIDATQKPLVGFMQVLAIIAVVWMGGIEVMSGRLSSEGLVAFFTGIALLIDPVIVLSRTNIALARALAATERFFEVIEIKPTVEDRENAAALPQIKGKVEFQNVSFSYEDSSMPALDRINTKVDPGQIVALVGPSGAGKTTFINLLFRFFDPKQGTILIDGQNIKTVKLVSLRKQMGIVPQETTLFSGAIRDNIAYGKIDATDQEVEEAAKIANAHDFIMGLENKYQTKVGERGVKLSGGQRQRIAIARAVLRNPKILILDEATSSLDSESEHLLQEALDHLMKNRTTFVIAHRLSTILHADKILVLDKGKIVEEGTHPELLEKDGLYKKLYEMQFRNI